MRDLGVCVHEAGHLIAMYYLGGRIATSLTWEPDGGATILAALKYEPPQVRALVAVMGHVASVTLAPHLKNGAGMSGADRDMFEDATDVAAGSIGIQRKQFASRVWKYAHAFVQEQANEIINLATVLHETGEVPAAYLHPAIVKHRRLKAQLKELQEQELEKEVAEAERLIETAKDARKAEQSNTPHLRPASGKHGIEYKVARSSGPPAGAMSDHWRSYERVRWLNSGGNRPGREGP